MSMLLYPPARPQSIGEVLDTTFKLLGVSLVKTLPYGVLMTIAGQLGNIDNLLTGRNARIFVPRDPATWALWIVSMIGSLLLWAALILRQRAIAQDAPVSMRAELASALQMLPSLAGLFILVTVAVLCGVLLLIVPGVYLAIALSMATPALVLAGKDPIDAMKYSLELIRGHWWRTLGIFLMTGVILCAFYILAIVVTVIVVRFARGADVALVTAATTVLVIALGAFANPCVTAMILAVFGDLEARRAASAASLQEA
jgi:hypothetical protein